MKRIELILASLALATFLLHLYWLQISGLFVVVTFALLSLAYWPAGILTLTDVPFRVLFTKSSYAHLSTGKVIGVVGLGMAFSAVILGLLFKLFQWPGAGINLLAGLIVLGIGSPIIVFKLQKTSSTFYRYLLLRALIFGAIGAIAFFM